MCATVEAKGSAVFSTWIGDKGKLTDFSYADIWDRSGAIAYTLINKYRIKARDRVILCYTFGLEFFVAFLACLRCGVIAVPVYPLNPAKLKMSLEKLGLIVNSCGATLCLTDDTIYWFRKAQLLNVLSDAKDAWPQNLKGKPQNDLPQEAVTRWTSQAFGIVIWAFCNTLADLPVSE